MFAKSMVVAFGCALSAAQVVAAPYDASVTALRALAAADPDYVTMMDIGVNDQGTPIYGVKIEAPGTAAAARPRHLVVGAHHGNEVDSVVVAQSFAKQLVEVLKNPAAEDYDRLVANTYFVVPVLNVTGYNARRREETAATERTLDSNRDYPDPCTTDTPYGLASTRNLAGFVGRENIVAAVTIHGYIGTFTYPWGIFTNDTHTRDHETFKTLATEPASISRYNTGTHADEIYPTAGAFEDWAYFEHGVWVMLLEVDNFPDADRDALSLLKFFAIAPTERSTTHDHLGECTRLPFTVMSRP